MVKYHFSEDKSKLQCYHLAMWPENMIIFTLEVIEELLADFKPNF